MKRLFGAGATLVLLFAGAALAIFGYNAWSWSCGRCCLRDLLYPGPAGFVLLGLSFTAALVLAMLRHRRRLAERRNHCRCGTPLKSNWLFCPACGTPSAR